MVIPVGGTPDIKSGFAEPAMVLFDVVPQIDVYPVEVSEIVTALLATWEVLPELLNNLKVRVSVPSKELSAVRVKGTDPAFAFIVTDPVRVFRLVSGAEIPVIDQYNTVPLFTLVVDTVTVTKEPSLAEDGPLRE